MSCVLNVFRLSSSLALAGTGFRCLRLLILIERLNKLRENLVRTAFLKYVSEDTFCL